MEKYKIDSLENLTPELIYELIQKFELDESPRLDKLYRYFKGQHDIMHRTFDDSSRPNNRVATAWGRHIVEQIVNYSLGRPVQYVANAENEELLTGLQDIFRTNNEPSHNLQALTDASIYGIGYELLYVDEEGSVKIDKINPMTCFLIHDLSIQERIIGAVRFYHVEDYQTGDKTLHAELYTNDKIQYFKDGDDSLIQYNEEPHYFGGIPVLPYFVNNDMMGHFEHVIPLIDAFDRTISDKLNFNDSISDAYMVITGISDPETNLKHYQEMRQKRLLMLEEGADAKWLVKDADTETTQMIEDLKALIFQSSGVPDLTSKIFGGSGVSGVSIKFKLQTLENIAAACERYLTHTIERRIKMIVNFINLKQNRTYDYREVRQQYTRNIADNLNEEADVVQKLMGITSNETLLNYLSIVPDVYEEMDRIEKERGKDSLASDFEMMQPVQPVQQMEQTEEE